ncbi:MAG: FeoB-associated Cys-rich membrane protein [Clostridia bacterium]|nr:FeoB-associated Cys-rich membrane protein [Clostridia bacterium]
MTQNIIIIAVLVAVVGLAVFAIIRSKKSGKKCIGCPESGCSECTCCNSKK